MSEIPPADTNEEGKTAVGYPKRKKRILPREADDPNDPNHLRKARKINGIIMRNWKPSYCLKRAVTPAGSLRVECESLRSRHREKLRRILKTLMLQHNWIGASGVMSILLKGTAREKSLSRNKFKYSATLELLQKIKGHNLKPYKVQSVYELWMKKLGSMKGWSTQLRLLAHQKNEIESAKHRVGVDWFLHYVAARMDRFAVQLESIIFCLCQGNFKEAHMAAGNLTQEQGFDSDSIANFLVGLTCCQLWYSDIPKEFQLEELNRSGTPAQSHLSECGMHMSFENSDGHDAVDTDGRDLPRKCDSSTSVGNERDNLKVYAVQDVEVSVKVNAALQKEIYRGSFQVTDRPEGSGSEESFYPNQLDVIPNASIFYTRGLPPWLLPLQLPQSTENIEEVLHMHKDMLNDYYKDALKHLRAALHLEPPVFEALHPLIQMLLLGDQVMEAFSELESVSHKIDTLLYIRLKASLLEYFVDHGNNVQLCTHFEDILKKDPTCSHSLAKLVSMHQFGIYSTEELVEMIALHLDAVLGDCSSWKEMASCLFKLSYCERDDMSTCCMQDDDEPKTYTNHVSQMPAIFTNPRTKHTWQLRCRWWITRHFSHKRLTLDITSGDLEFLTYKVAIASYLYGWKFMYSIKATEHLRKENRMDMLAILQTHFESASGFCSSLQKWIL